MDFSVQNFQGCFEALNDVFWWGYTPIMVIDIDDALWVIFYKNTVIQNIPHRYAQEIREKNNDTKHKIIEE